MTVGDALRLAARRLGAAGVPDAAWDAELLIRHVLGWDRAAVLSREAQELPADAEARFLSLVAEREGRRPLQHLTGTQSFYGRDFVVTKDVLIPRPETEILVEAALQILNGHETGTGPSAPVVMDVGTGSGCIALTIAAEHPTAEVHGVDISPEALEVARTNARRLGLEGRVRFYQGDLTTSLRDLVRRVDLVVSNPPYVRAADVAGLMPEVRDHEPRLALVAAPDAARLYRRLTAGARRLLRPGGTLLLEVGHGLAQEVSAICGREGLRVERVIPDLQGIPRVVVALRPASHVPAADPA